MNNFLVIRSKDLSREISVCLWEVQKLAREQGGYRETRAKIDEIKPTDSSNIGAAFANGEHVFSFASDGKMLSICG